MANSSMSHAYGYNCSSKDSHFSRYRIVYSPGTCWGNYKFFRMVRPTSSFRLNYFANILCNFDCYYQGNSRQFNLLPLSNNPKIGKYFLLWPISYGSHSFNIFPNITLAINSQQKLLDLALGKNFAVYSCLTNFHDITSQKLDIHSALNQLKQLKRS